MELAEVPCLQVGKGQVLIQEKASLISAGTGKMLVEFSKANLFGKARQQPDKVKQVLDKIKTDGLVLTLTEQPDFVIAFFSSHFLGHLQCSLS